MTLKYQENDFEQDLNKLIKQGGFALCFEPAYQQDFLNYIAHDLKALEKLLNSDEDKAVLINYREMTDVAASSRGKPVFKIQALRQAFFRAFGEEGDEILSRTRIMWREESGGISFGETWKQMGKGGLDGVCITSVPKRLIVVYGTGRTRPEQEINGFYHESCHALQVKYSCFNDKNSRLAAEYLDKLIRREDFAGEGLKRRLFSAYHYHKYKLESQAETFAAAVRLLKTPDNETFEQERKAVSAAALLRLWGGLGDKQSCYYNCFGAVKQLGAELRQAGEKGRRSFCRTGGGLDFVKILRYTEKLVNENSYGKAAFLRYRGFCGGEKELAELDKTCFKQLAADVPLLRDKFRPAVPSKPRRTGSLVRLADALKCCADEDEVKKLFTGLRQGRDAAAVEPFLRLYEQRQSGELSRLLRQLSSRSDTER